jgi:hypothetical protein
VSRQDRRVTLLLLFLGLTIAYWGIGAFYQNDKLLKPADNTTAKVASATR